MNNKVFLYNNSFINLLTLINNCLINETKPGNIKNLEYSPNLLDEIINLNLVDNNKVINIIKRNYGDEVLRVMYYVYLSDEDKKELKIYYLYLNCLKYKRNILNMRNLNCVSKSLKIAKYVSSEAHKMKGFLRFKELDNKVLYAQMSPTNNIISIVSNHFQKRLQNEYWMIEDKKRKIISLYDKKNIYYLNSKNIIVDNKVNKKELEEQELWQIFYKTIGIKERQNDRCRMNFMPKKYWKYMIEMSDEK